jgi:hypothetical protein
MSARDGCRCRSGTLAEPLAESQNEPDAPSNKGLKVTRPGQVRCLAAHSRCPRDAQQNLSGGAYGGGKNEGGRG